MYEHKNIQEFIDKFDHSSPIPLHIQVEELLLEIIKLPDYANGKLLPKELDLAKSLGISRSTIRQASNRLAEKNLIVRKKGIGTKINKEMLVTRLDSWSSFSKEMLEQGKTLVNYEFKLKKIMSDKTVSFKLGIDIDTPVYRLSRVRGIKDESKVYFISYFHPKINLDEKSDFSKPLYDLIELSSGYIATVSKEEISAIISNDKLSDKLNVAIGDPILRRERVVLDRGMSPLEYNIGYYKADNFIYSVELRR
ncbi:GntR family transcriptional regulator [Winogradskyella bathintestinalis]|uniref:GntR family transcriptional regulator n=1 Tax=Winogradskyella bathintestinalis TaxID=3035208 RepID=A0ABT7ZX22_9FLAO|nr:GntR family transcriptional regulator [Winogradskyella bathintestinalis]MDN3493540.1 GntR family transcriptional regulator [Winogradskyella bathintestinalis]